MSLVRSLARRYSYRGEQLEDLVQIGAIGLIKAIDRFDLDRGVELTTYATPNIIGEIKRHFRDKGWSVRVPRGLQELNVQLSRLIETADGAARPLADDPRAREGGGRRGGGSARGARVRPRVLVALALGGRRRRRRGRPRPARVDRDRGARVRGVGGPRRARAGLPRRSTSGSGRSSSCASSTGSRSRRSRSRSASRRCTSRG